MATLQNPKDLAAVLGETIDTDSPLDALKARGFTFSEELQKQIAIAESPKILSPQERAHWRQKAKAIGPVRFDVRTVAFAAPSLPAGEYDFIFAVRLGIVNEVLAALYSGFTWPHEIAQIFPILPQFAVSLLNALRSFADGIPEGGTSSWAPFTSLRPAPSRRSLAPTT